MFQAKYSEPAIELLRGIGFDPDVLLVGVTNEGDQYIEGLDRNVSLGERHRIKLGRYRAAFPRAALIDFPENAVGVKGCSAEEGLCTVSEKANGGHQCSPGPLARVAEEDARAILAALEQRAHVNSVASSLAMDRNQVEHIVESLSSEGHWSIDDEHRTRRASRDTLRV